MDQAPSRDLDRRTQRTRKAISDAFVSLIFTRRYGAIRTADVIEAAGVGRSTFVLFDPPLAIKLQRKLAAMIEARLAKGEGETPPASLIAMGAAAQRLAMLRMWLTGEATCSSEALARQFLAP
jgi:hypothetical protein